MTMRRRFTSLGVVDSLKKVDVKLKRGMKVRLRVRDADGKPIARAFMPMPQVYLARHRKDAWFSLAYKDPDTRFPAVERTNFLNVRPEAGGDFTFQLAADQSEPLYFGFSHPDVLLYYEKGPVTASDLAGGVWDVVLPRPASVEISLKCPRRHGWKTLVRERLFQPDSGLPWSERPRAGPRFRHAQGDDSGERRSSAWHRGLTTFTSRRKRTTGRRREAICWLGPANFTTCASSTSSQARRFPSRLTRRRSTRMPGEASSRRIS